MEFQENFELANDQLSKVHETTEDEAIEKWSVLKKKFCKKLENQQEPFWPNTDNSLEFFIVFEWSKNFENTVD